MKEFQVALVGCGLFGESHLFTAAVFKTSCCSEETYVSQAHQNPV